MAGGIFVNLPLYVTPMKLLPTISSEQLFLMRCSN